MFIYKSNHLESKKPFYIAIDNDYYLNNESISGESDGKYPKLLTKQSTRFQENIKLLHYAYHCCNVGGLRGDR